MFTLARPTQGPSRPSDNPLASLHQEVASPHTFTWYRWPLALKLTNQLLRASDLSAAASSSWTAFTEVESVSTLSWAGLGVRETHSYFGLLPRSLQPSLCPTEGTLSSHIRGGFTRGARSLSYKTFSFAFTTDCVTRGSAFGFSLFYYNFQVSLMLSVF